MLVDAAWCKVSCDSSFQKCSVGLMLGLCVDHFSCYTLALANHLLINLTFGTVWISSGKKILMLQHSKSFMKTHESFLKKHM